MSISMSDDERGFLDTIIKSPVDDTPRLVFADWLEENGHEDRADFIRTQIEIARVRPLVELDHYAIWTVAEPIVRVDGNCVTEPAFRVWLPGSERIDITDGEELFGNVVVNEFRRPDISSRRVVITFVMDEQSTRNHSETQVQPARWAELRAVEMRLCQSFGLSAASGVCWAPPDNFNRPVTVDIRRGFVERVHIAWDEWLERADVIVASAPIMDVYLTTFPIRRDRRGFRNIQFHLPKIAATSPEEHARQAAESIRNGGVITMPLGGSYQFDRP